MRRWTSDNNWQSENAKVAISTAHCNNPVRAIIPDFESCGKLMETSNFWMAVYSPDYDAFVLVELGRRYNE